MPKSVWKYVLEPFSEIPMPIGAEILQVREQGADICMWALADPEMPREQRTFKVVGTGHNAPQMPMKYHGSAHLEGGSLVWHVFELLKR